MWPNKTAFDPQRLKYFHFGLAIDEMCLLAIVVLSVSRLKIKKEGSLNKRTKSEY